MKTILVKLKNEDSSMGIFILFGGILLAICLPFIFYAILGYLLAPFEKRLNTFIKNDLIKSLEELSKFCNPSSRIDDITNLKEEQIEEILDSTANYLK